MGITDQEITFLKRYGPIVIPGVILLAIAVWLLAHFSAAPNTQVTVLWGLVQYTKQPPQEVKQEEIQQAVPTGVRPTQAEKNSPLDTHKIIAVESTSRTYLNARPIAMLQSVAGMTRMQATLFQEATYSNKWIRINGPLSEVMGSSSYATLVFHIDGVVTRVDMKGEFVSKVSHLVRGDVVTVDAVFKSMDDIGPDFEEGELVATP